MKTIIKALLLFGAQPITFFGTVIFSVIVMTRPNLYIEKYLVEHHLVK